MIPKHEIDEAITALEHFNEGMQNKINKELFEFQGSKCLEMIPASFSRRDDPSIKVPGKIAWCGCKNSNFGVFQLDHQDHLHLQCSHCGTCYCPMGKCKL